MKNGPHILLCSESGTAKSTFAATTIAIPPQIASKKPVLVQAFDPSDKLTPYRKRGDETVLERWEYGLRERILKEGVCVAIIERWHEKQGRASAGITMQGGKKVETSRHVLQGKVWESYLQRMKHFVAECEDEYWAFILDSTTFAEYAARAYLSGVMKVLDNKMIWGQATDELEAFLLATFPDLSITTIVISHSVPKRVNERDERGRSVKVRGDEFTPREARLPGRLANDVFAAFGEAYRGYVATKKGGIEYYLQTRRDEIWYCASQLGVDDPLGPSPQFRSVYDKATKMLPLPGAEKGDKKCE